MTKFQSTTKASSMPAMRRNVRENSSQEVNEPSAAQPTPQPGDPLPWLIRQLRGQYECDHGAANKTIVDTDA